MRLGTRCPITSRRPTCSRGTELSLQPAQLAEYEIELKVKASLINTERSKPIWCKESKELMVRIRNEISKVVIMLGVR